MRNAKWFIVSLVVFCCLAGLGVFAFPSLVEAMPDNMPEFVDTPGEEKPPDFVVPGIPPDFVPRTERCEPGFHPTPVDVMEDYGVPECSPVIDISHDIKFQQEREGIDPNIYVDPKGNEFEIPTPGGIGAGVTIKSGYCGVSDYADMHGRMWVRPNGVGNLNVNSQQNWLFTTTTNRSRCNLEVLAIYHENDQSGSIGVYDWSLNNCTSSGYQFTWDLATTASCYVKQLWDSGNHQGWYVEFDNVTDKPGSQFRNYALFYNRCLFRWDKVYEHYYSTSSIDCQNNNGPCWWGPILETFDLTPVPQIWEVGIQSMILDTRKNGTWTCSGLLNSTSTSWTTPQSPWNTYHRSANHNWGVGNFLGLN